MNLVVSGALTSTTGQLDDADTQRLVVNALDRQAGGPDDNSAQAGHLIPCIHADAIGRDGISRTPGPDAAGNVRLRDAGLGVATDGQSFNLTTGKPHAVATTGVRRLTPVECERLMSWPDDWTAIDGADTPDSRRYAACGDGVVSNVAEWIAAGILREDAA